MSKILGNVMFNFGESGALALLFFGKSRFRNAEVNVKSSAITCNRV